MAVPVSKGVLWVLPHPQILRTITSVLHRLSPSRDIGTAVRRPPHSLRNCVPSQSHPYTQSHNRIQPTKGHTHEMINPCLDLRMQNYRFKPEEGRALCSLLASYVHNPAGLCTAPGKGPQQNKGGGASLSCSQPWETRGSHWVTKLL